MISANYPNTTTNVVAWDRISVALSSTSYITTGTSGMVHHRAQHAPDGPPLPPVPEIDSWISEKTPNAQPRQIKDVVVGKHILCKGRRISIIQWKNLNRYVLVNKPLIELDKVS